MRIAGTNIINKILHMGYTYMTTGMYNGEGKN